MKPIELTEEHESKLLEMCKTLFPEYLVPTIQSNGYINIAETEYSSDYIDLIHWFEFCILHLATKIYNKLDCPERGFSILYYRGYICQNSDNPIDYLYEEFKKLK